MEILPVNLENELELCLAFRADAYVASFGFMDGFSKKSAEAWLRELVDKPSGYLLHAEVAGQIIGQLEYVSRIDRPDGTLGGYINLIYLKPEFRRQGYGQQLHDHILAALLSDDCVEAALRYIPGNIVAEQFYLKNAWLPLRKADETGQLMVRKL